LYMRYHRRVGFNHCFQLPPSHVQSGSLRCIYFAAEKYSGHPTTQSIEPYSPLPYPMHSCPMMHTIQVYKDVPAIECGDGSLMSDSFPPTAHYEDYHDGWTLSDPALLSYPSIEGHDAASTAHLRSLQRHVSNLAYSASGHGSLSPTAMLGHEFSYLGLQPPFSSDAPNFHAPRYMSPNGHLGGSLSSIDSASECASSPDAARHSAKPYYGPYDSQEMCGSPIYGEDATFGNWAPQRPYQHNIIHSPSPYDTTVVGMKDVQFAPDFGIDDDTLENDTIKVAIHGPEELSLSPGRLSFRDEGLGQSVRDDASSFQDEGEETYQESEADSEYSPELAKRRNSNPVRSAARKTPRKKSSTTNTVLGDAKVTKPTPRKSSATRCPSGRPPKSAANAQKRIFTCAFSHYGCEATFGSKNEWKRHVGSQHLQLGFYRCDTGFCNPDAQSSSAKSHPSASKTYNDFNRKDLFTQHHRRMHTPWSSASKEPSAKVMQEFEESLKEVQQRCWHERRTPPQRSSCGFCRRVFEGPTGWEERMEHVGKHFEGKHNGVSDAEKLQEEEDEDLRDWAIREGIVRNYGGRGFWLVGMEPAEVPAAGARSSRRRGKVQHDVLEDEDVDAEGENE